MSEAITYRSHRSCLACGSKVRYGVKRCDVCTEIRAKAAATMAEVARAAAELAEKAARTKARKNAWAARYRERNREKLAADAKQRRIDKPEEGRRLSRQRHARRPEVVKNGNNRRKARIKSDRLSNGLSRFLFEQQGGKCACCGESLEPGYHLDHIVPLARGGRNIDSNMQLLTPKCNLRKGAKSMGEYMNERRREAQWANQ